MFSPFLCLAAALTALPGGDDWVPIYNREPAFEVAIRGQDPGYEPMPTPGEGTYAPEGSMPNPGAPMTDPYATQQPYLSSPPYGGNPWTNDPYAFEAASSPTAGLYTWGLTGPRPYQFGWVSQYDTGFLPKEPTENGLGQLSIFEFDGEWKYTTPSVYQNIFSYAQQFSLRGYDGPMTPPGQTTALPGEVYHIGWDFEFATPLAGNWFAQFGFNPSVNSDFRGSLSSEAWNWDGRAILYYRQNPQLTWAMGAGFWDRVDDRVVPYAGFIYAPGNRWEYRLVFPQPSISYYAGRLFGFEEWAYVRGEWHIEAYELQLQTTNQRERVELEDWRLLIGNRKTNGFVTIFIEGGWVFGRNVEYANGTPGFDVSSGFIVQAGLTY